MNSNLEVFPPLLSTAAFKISFGPSFCLGNGKALSYPQGLWVDRSFIFTPCSVIRTKLQKSFIKDIRHGVAWNVVWSMTYSILRMMARVTCLRARRVGTLADMLPVYCMENFPAAVLVDQWPWLMIIKTLERWEPLKGCWMGGKTEELEMTRLRV